MDYNLKELCSALNAASETFVPDDNPSFDELSFSDATHAFTLRIFDSLGLCNVLCSGGSEPKPRGVFEFTFKCDRIETFESDDATEAKTYAKFFRRLEGELEVKLMIARIQPNAVVIEAYG